MRTVIIGGGVHGCAAAWYLATAGVEVELFEADTIASGASGGLGERGVRANGRDLRELPLMRAAYRYWPELAERLGAETGYRGIGGLTLIEQDLTGTKGGLLAARAHADVQNQHGIPTEVLDAERVRELEPEVNDAVRGALYCPMDGVADHTATTRAFAAAAAKHGANLHERTPIERIEYAENRAVAVHTANGTRHEVGETLLLLNNTGVRGLLEDLGVRLPVWWMLPQVIRVMPNGDSPVRHLVGHDHRTLSAKTLPDGQVMISGGWRGDWDATLGRGVTVPEQVEGNLRTASEVFPRLAEARFETAEADTPESCGADQIPIIDTVPGAHNTMLGTGWTGHGFAIAPAVGAALAEWVSTGKRPSHLAPFALRRFAGEH